MTVEVMLRTIPVEHVTIVSSTPFADVRDRLETLVPRLDRTIVDSLNNDEEDEVAAYEEYGPKLSIFLERDHGALLETFGGARNAIQYEIGNPLTAATMTHYRLDAALYAPLRVVLYENAVGLSVIEYDRPSSLFGQFGDERITEVGRGLDESLEAVLNDAVSTGIAA